MQTEGRLTICDRCGKQVFSRCIGQTSQNCGQQMWGVFEELPEGWTTEQEKFLCPVCSREFAMLKRDFLANQISTTEKGYLQKRLARKPTS